MTPSAIEFKDSCESLFIVEIELLDIRRDLVENDPLIRSILKEALRYEAIMKQNEPQRRVFSPTPSKTSLSASLTLQTTSHYLP